MPVSIESPTRFNHPMMKLGKRAVKEDPRNLRLRNYVTPVLPPPPTRAGYVEKVKRWPMYLNDTLGDCVIAGMGHMIQEWTAEAGKPTAVTDDDVLKVYEHVGGYVPGDATTDNGCFMLDALKYWRNNGIAGHKIMGFVSVNFYNRVEVMHAIHLFGSAFIGVGLPISAQHPKIAQPSGLPCFQVPDYGPIGYGSPGSWGGHAVPLFGYSDGLTNPGTMAVSWGGLWDMTWNFIQAYCDEMYVAFTDDWFNAAGKTPTGLNLQQLAADLLEFS